MTDLILQLRDVTVRFGGVVACDVDHVGIRRGELFALIGPNGAGKTSLLNAISGIYRAEPGGSIIYTDQAGSDHQLVSMRPFRIVRLGVARTFQNLGLFPDLSVLENLMVGRYTSQRSGVFRCGLHTSRMLQEESEARAYAEELLERFNLVPYRRASIGELPYGIQKRLEFARVLALEPDLLLLDEPMAGMGEDDKREMIEHVQALQRTSAVTVVLIEHDMNVVMSVAERVLALNFGRQMAFGTPDEVRADPAVIEAYLGAE